MPASLTFESGNRRSGVLGLAAASAFLLFVGKYSDCPRQDGLQCLESRACGRQPALLPMAAFIVGRACGLREALTVVRLSLMLLLRTVGSVYVSRHWGRMVNSVVSQKFKTLRQQVTEFAGATVMLALLNSLLKYYISLFRLQFREKITRWCHEVYMRPGEMVFYKANKAGDGKVDHLAHQVTSEVERFSDASAEVVSQSLKPIVDFFVYSYELSRVQGLATPLTLYSWFAGASYLASLVLPPYGDLAAERQRLEAQFLGSHVDLINHCEQVAFLGGERPEKALLDQRFETLMKHCRGAANLNFNFEIVRQYLNKYFVTVIGLLLVVRPLQLRRHTCSSEEIAQYFSSTWRNMEALTASIQSILDLSKLVGLLSGLASRVEGLMARLEKQPRLLESQIQLASAGLHPPTYKVGETLQLDHVSIYKPDGVLLLRDLNLTVERGQRILVTGGNGCGKSSLFRVIRKLWPLVEGTVTSPALTDIHFLPQTSFVPTGTLRDLVTYPLSQQEIRAMGRTDEEVHACLRWAHMMPAAGLTASRGNKGSRTRLELMVEGGVTVRAGLDDIRDWQRDLTPGQKQRIAFARLFFHRPSLVMLDECTNGVSPDVEHDLYDRCAKLGLTVFSISHKIELKLFHDFELRFNGDAEGSWTLTRCSDTQGKVTVSSALLRLPDSDRTGKAESRITYERHIWFAD